jgi:hypothetical protein
MMAARFAKPGSFRKARLPRKALLSASPGTAATSLAAPQKPIRASSILLATFDFAFAVPTVHPACSTIAFASPDMVFATFPNSFPVREWSL